MTKMAQLGSETPCSTLSANESKQSLGGKKSKKMVFKSMLMPLLPLPLDRLLSGSDDLDVILSRDLKTVSDNKSSRACLALGANAVTKQLGKKNLAAVILAADIQPPSLIAHVITKAIAGNVPLLKINKLRDVTKQSLGFECIAVGFKKDSTMFKNSITAIERQHFQQQEPTTVDVTDEEGSSPLPVAVTPLAFQKRTFKYEIRDASKPGRSFIPELSSSAKKESTINFITIEDGEEIEVLECSAGISSSLLRDNNVVPKKKQKTTFTPAKIVKVQTNRKKGC